MINDIKIHIEHPIHWLKCLGCGGLGYNQLGNYKDGEPINRNCKICNGIGIMGKYEKTEYERNAVDISDKL